MGRTWGMVGGETAVETPELLPTYLRLLTQSQQQVQVAGSTSTSRV